MKTSDLIAALAADTTPVRRASVARNLLIASVVGSAATIVVLVAWLGLNPLMPVLGASWFWMKGGFAATLALSGFLLLNRLARPGAPVGRAALAIGALALVVMAMLAMHSSMHALPGQMCQLWLGDTWKVCPFRILLLSIPVYLGLTWALRRLAPTRLALTGAAAGLAAGALAAVIYGLYCREWAAPFVFVWYSLGVGLSAAFGALVGTRLLRW